MTGKRRRGREPKRQSSPPASPPSASPAPLDDASVVITPHPTRRQARLQRRRQRNRRVGVAGGVAIAIVVAVLIALGVFVGPKVVHHYTKTAKPTQTTVLMQIQGPGNTAAASVLLAQGPGAAQGVEVLIPGRLITDVCGYGTEDFGNVLALPGGAAASRQTLTALLDDVTVNGSWILTSAQLTTLVNRLHGITADVDVNVVRRNPDGTATVLVPAGNAQRLTGVQAAEYATYTASRTEDASGQLARLQQVVDGVLQALPTSPTPIAALLRQIGGTGASTLGASRLATFLSALAADNRSQTGLFPTDLPVTSIDSGGAPSYQVDDSSTTGVRALVTNHLADSVPPGGGKPEPSVLLLNGIGKPGLVKSACPRLAANGLAYAGSNNAATFSDTNPSVIEIRSNSDVGLGDKVAHALGLPTADIERNPNDQSIADVIVTLGRDYQQ